MPVTFDPLASARIYDASQGHTAMDPGIRPLWTGARISAAPAATATTGAGDAGSLAAAIAAAGPGDVLVVDGNGHTGRALWTAVETLAAIRHGVVGLVLDGLVRDLDTIQTLRFPVFARGTRPIGPHYTQPGSMGGPTYCGGLLIQPGDCVVADADGVVVVPAEDRDAVLHTAREHAERLTAALADER